MTDYTPGTNNVRRTRCGWRDKLEPQSERLVGINKNFIHYGAIVRLGKRYGAASIDGVWGLYLHARKLKSRSFKLKSRYEGLKILGWPRQMYPHFEQTLTAIHRRTFIVRKWYRPGRAHRKKRRVKIGRVRRGSDGSVRVTFTQEFWRVNDIKLNGGYVALVPAVGLTKLKTVAEKMMLLLVCAFSFPLMHAETWMGKLGLTFEYEKKARAKLVGLAEIVERVYGRPLAVQADRHGEILVAKLDRGEAVLINPVTGEVEIREAEDSGSPEAVDRRFQNAVERARKLSESA